MGSGAPGGGGCGGRDNVHCKLGVEDILEEDSSGELGLQMPLQLTPPSG
jgi:hypothetical protein